MLDRDKRLLQKDRENINCNNETNYFLSFNSFLVNSTSNPVSHKFYTG